MKSILVCLNMLCMLMFCINLENVDTCLHVHSSTDEQNHCVFFGSDVIISILKGVTQILICLNNKIQNQILEGES